MLHRLAACILVLLFPSLCLAEIQTRAIPYQHGDVQLEGFLAWDDGRTGKRPGILVVHEWWGLNEYARGIDALKYDRQADERSWQQMQLFFHELFQGS